MTTPLIHSSASLLVKGIEVRLRKTHKLSMFEQPLASSSISLDHNISTNDRTIFVVCAFTASTVNNLIHLTHNDAEYGKWRQSKFDKT